MLLIEYDGHIGLRSLTDGDLGRNLEYFITLNDARVASVGFIKYNASTTRINDEKNFKIKSRSFWFSTGLIGQDSQYQTVILGTDFSIRSLHYNMDPVPTILSFIQRLQNI